MSKKTIRVMWHEFRRHITRRSFLFTLFGLPLLLSGIMYGVIYFFTVQGDDPVGIVDQAGIGANPTAYAEDSPGSVPFRIFDDETAAQAALNDEMIQAYVIVPADYLDTGAVTLFHNGELFEGVSGDVNTYLRYSLLAEGDPLLQTRFQDTLDVEFISLTEGVDNRNPLAMILPFAVGFIFLIAIFTTSGTLIQAVVDEKENRTMEILITSLRPSELMTGKIIGLVGLGLVQIAVWLGFVFAAILIARANVENFPTITISPRAVMVAVAWFVPFYLMIAALVTAIGVSVTAVSEAQQAVSLISIVSMFPLYFTFLIVANPHSALSLTLSFIPFSSPLTMLARVQATSNIPVWQYGLSWGLLALSAWLAVFLVGRVLHLGMLRYGQRLRWRDMARALWQRGS